MHHFSYHMCVCHQVIPIMRVLMRDKTEAAYMALFNYIKAIAPNLQPTRFHCEFERAQVNAIRQAFPGCAAEATLWHYAVVRTDHIFVTIYKIYQ